MALSMTPLLRRAAACLDGAFSIPFAIVVAVVAAIASSH